MALPEIAAHDIVYILNDIEKAMITKILVKKIEDFSDSSKYNNAELFRFQVIHSFYRMIQEQLEEHPRELNFEEVVKYMKEYIDTKPTLIQRITMLKKLTL